jgi:tetratricopeptide (TPR) repeat protein
MVIYLHTPITMNPRGKCHKVSDYAIMGNIRIQVGMEEASDLCIRGNCTKRADNRACTDDVIGKDHSIRGDYAEGFDVVMGVIKGTKYFGFGIDPRSPRAESKFIHDYMSGLRLGNDYDSGAYLLWALWPDNKIFIDSRYFPYKSWVHEYWGLFQSSAEVKDSFMRKYRCDAWCVSYYSPELYSYFLSSPNWRLVHYGPTACIFVPRNSPFDNKGHLVNEATYRIEIHQLVKLLEFSKTINDVSIPQTILERLKINTLIPYQKKAFGIISNDLGLFLLSKNRTEEAMKVFSRAAQIEPDNPVTYINMGYAEHAKMNNMYKAIKNYKKALSIDPNMFETQYNLGNIFLSLNYIQDAILHLTKASDINKDDTMAKICLDKALSKKAEMEGSISQLQQKLLIRPNDIVALRSLSILNSQLGQFDESIKYLTMISQLVPGNGEVEYNIACVYARWGKIDESLKHLEKAVNHGFSNWKLMGDDHDLDAIRDTKYYKQLRMNHEG